MKYRKGNNDWIGTAANVRQEKKRAKGSINNTVYLFLCNRTEQLTTATKKE
jgi:hypothetical protein